MTGIPSGSDRRWPASGSHWCPRRSLWCGRRGSVSRRACPSRSPSRPGSGWPESQCRNRTRFYTNHRFGSAPVLHLLFSYLMGAESGGLRRRQFGHGCFLQENTVREMSVTQRCNNDQLFSWFLWPELVWSLNVFFLFLVCLLIFFNTTKQDRRTTLNKLIPHSK